MALSRARGGHEISPILDREGVEGLVSFWSERGGVSFTLS